MPSSPPAGRLEIANDDHALAHKAAEWFSQTVSAHSGSVRISLSGGSTPKELYALLRGDGFRMRIPWQRLEIFWGDERFVPHEDPASNYRMAKDALLAHAPIPAGNIHPVPVNGTPREAAAQHETLLKRSDGAQR